MKRGLIFVLMFVFISVYVSAIYCGDNILDEGEFCDTDRLNYYTCLNFSYDGGILGCLDDCSDFDYDECFGDDICGNGIVDSDELCDGGNVRGRTCEDEGYGSGTLICESNCNHYDVSGCGAPAEICGNGIINGTEECEGSDVGESTCVSLGFNSGILSCVDCMFSTEFCANNTESFNETEDVLDNNEQNEENNEDTSNVETSENTSEGLDLSFKQLIIYALIVLVVGIIISYVVIFKIQK